MLATLPRLIQQSSRTLALLSTAAVSTTGPSCSNSSKGVITQITDLPPLRYHLFSEPIPYPIGLKLQNDIIDVRLKAKAEASLNPLQSRGVGDVILFLEHTPTYTTGRRDNSPNPNELHPEEKKVQNVGAGFYITKRGGQVTYHGPGQLVGYPILDLNVMETPTRCYVEYLQGLLAEYARDDLGLEGILAPHPEGHVGVFSSPTEKVASIGIHLRHRITSHGFAMNITPEPIKWFDLVMACGLSDVKAISIHQLLSRSSSIQSSALPSVSDTALSLVPKFGEIMGRSIVDLSENSSGEGDELVEIRELVMRAEDQAKEENRSSGGWRSEPDLSKRG